MCAHPRIDPLTGEMLLFAYDVEAPFLTWAIVGPDGTVTSGPTPLASVDQGFMIHDFTITATYLVLVVAPVVFDLDAMMTGGDVLSWQPDLGTRIALVPRASSTASSTASSATTCTPASRSTTTRSQLVVWDAQTFPSAPVGEVLLPHRVPNGLHGNWMPTEGSVGVELDRAVGGEAGP